MQVVIHFPFPHIEGFTLLHFGMSNQNSENVSFDKFNDANLVAEDDSDSQEQHHVRLLFEISKNLHSVLLLASCNVCLLLCNTQF